MKLASLLSAGAQICQPGSECFLNATTRFVSNWRAPSFDLVVKVATQEDVQHTIEYANHRGQPFLAISGKHGATNALGNVHHGIGILMRGLTDLTIAENGESATVGGGLTSGELINRLWDQGKQAVIGGCECTGVVSPILGGGHGFLQGQYGLLADNLISAELVLANGSAITVSESQHTDLFWALRGAGQNYGIVTSFQYKIYDHTPENELWSYDTMVFPLDKVEAIYEIAEEQRRAAPVELGHWGLVAPAADANSNRSLIFTVFYQSSSLPPQYTTPFHALHPLASTPGTVPFPGFARIVGLSNTDLVCQTGGPNRQAWPANLAAYNTADLRAAIDIFSTMPPPFHQSAMLIEGYSARAVQAVPEESTAYPDRSRPLLLSPLITYDRERGDLARLAMEYGKRIQGALVEGRGSRGKLHSYVNYAVGTESREALYGYEPWRLEKLRALKEVYDPLHKFDFYVPLGDGPKGREKDCERSEL